MVHTGPVPPGVHPRTSTLLPARLVALALGAVLVLASCTPATGEGTAEPAAPPSGTSPPGRSPSGTSASPPDASASPPGDDGTPLAVLTSGEVDLEVSAPAGADPVPATEVRAIGDGAGLLEVAIGASGPDAGDPAPVRLTLRTPGTFEVNVDGTVTVVGPDGAAAIGGLTAPAGTARWTAVGPEAVDLVPTPADDGSTTPRPPEVTAVLGTSGVVSARWGDREGGRSLAIDATSWARDAGEAGVDVVWSELVADDPEIDSATMHDQLVCHSIGAPDKETWNLEPWRPDVGLLAVLAERCNPTIE